MKFATAMVKGLMALSIALVTGCASSAKQEGSGQYIDDAMITAKVKTALLNEPTLKSMEINVETFKGRVQLSGFVSTQANASTALAVAREVAGVSTVRDDMRLK
jgi:osmotically-inducible protein OsmY